MDVGKALRLCLASSSLFSLAACGYTFGGSSSPNYEKPTAECASAAIPGQYIVRYKDGTQSVEKALSFDKLSRRLSAANSKQIDYIENDYRLRIQGFSSKAGSAKSRSDEAPDSWGQLAVGADQAWSIAQGDGVTVAVVDAGVDVNHPQLRNQLAVNAGEIPGNGLDDDGNGLVDDSAGYDFGIGSGKVQDPPESTHHGSHVSGIIVAEHIAGGIKGLAPKAKLLPLVFMDKKGEGSTSRAVAAINYAVDRGAKIINASWGAEVCSSSLRDTIRGLESRGVLFVAAAGNGNEFGIGYDLDYRKAYPAAYPFAGQITVGAMDKSGVMTGFSNFSRSLVHLLAPGLDIWSTVYDDGTSPNHGYEKMDGTSMATPFVSGAAAVLWSHRPKATIQQIRAALLNSVTPGQYRVSTGGSLNLPQALGELERTVAP